MQSTDNSIENNESIDTKQHFISDGKFSLLRQCQKEIFEATETSPSIRKIVNELINSESLEKLKSKYIAVWSN